jgi:signal transduction histidine kinase/ActR/RegA family two-component response regulator
MLRFVITFLLLNLVFIHSSYSLSDDNSIILADGPIEINLQGSLQWLKADHNSFSLGQLQLSKTPQFENLKLSPVIESTDTYWLRFHVINPFNNSLPLALSLSDNTVNVEGAYRLTQKKWSRIEGFEKEYRLAGHTAMVMNFQDKTEQWIYLRISSQQTSKLEPKLEDLAHYTQSQGFLQQLLGAMIALMGFISLLHLIALRFHHHIRHYLSIYLASVVCFYGLSHLPLNHWPSWLDSICNLTLWAMACGLALSSFDTNWYQTRLKSNHSVLVILILSLITLILINLSYTSILVAALIPGLFALIRSRAVSLQLFLSALTLMAFIGWQLSYLSWPEKVPAPDVLSKIFATSLCVFLASMSMIQPYFQRQSQRTIPSHSNKNSEFLSHLSHELRSPMNGVLGMSELLNETPLSNTQRDYVDTIQMAGQDILRMTDRISDYAKITSGRLQLEDNQVDLVQLVEDVIQRFQYGANQKGIELVLNLSPDIQDFIVIDERRLQTLIDYLLENALHHTEHGEVELRITWDAQNNGQNLLFAIRDTGNGMRKEVLKNLFVNMDKQEGGKENFQLSGLGLELTKRLVKLMGGEMYVDSTPGLGSTFSFSLPYRLATQDMESQSHVHLLQGLSMLIVDDNSTLRKVIQRYAKSWGLQADCTYSGKEALAMLRSQSNLKSPYDIILIDQNMPIMDGFQLATRIKEDKEINQDILKIMLTGLGISSKHKDVLSSGIHQVINKPVSARVLQQTLAQHIQRKNVFKLGKK